MGIFINLKYGFIVVGGGGIGFFFWVSWVCFFGDGFVFSYRFFSRGEYWCFWGDVSRDESGCVVILGKEYGVWIWWSFWMCFCFCFEGVRVLVERDFYGMFWVGLVF